MIKSFLNISEMNFNISKEQQKFLLDVHSACENIRMYEQECYLEEKHNDKIIPIFSEIGMLGCPISKEYGGSGYDILTYLLSLERIGREGSSLRTFFSAHTSIGQMVLQDWSNDEQKKEYLPNTTDGSDIMAFALTEPSAGSDPASMETRYEKMGECYILNGKKHWIGNGTICDIFTVYAKSTDSQNTISAFIVEKEFEGLKFEEIKNKIGLSTVKNAIIYFNNCKVPKKNLLGIEGQGLNIAYSALIDGRLSVAAGSLGVMQDCLDESISYSKERVQHKSALAKKQLIQQHLSQILINIESSKWLVYRSSIERQKLHDYIISLKEMDDEWILKLNRHNLKYNNLRREADKMAAISKYHATNSAMDAANRALQIFGSEAYRKTNRVARHFLDTRATLIYEGANEVLQLKIASLFLGKEYSAY